MLRQNEFEPFIKKIDNPVIDAKCPKCGGAIVYKELQHGYDCRCEKCRNGISTRPF